MDETSILVDERAGYRVITLNRPQRLNAFTEAMHVELRVALNAAGDDPACRALLITGAGRGFWRRARRISSSRLRRSGWCRIPAGPGICRGSSAPRVRGRLR
jgi:2-(1,2-epoxy-1,2-dihydrophenyl)acetyl-CoA isomerase